MAKKREPVIAWTQKRREANPFFQIATDGNPNSLRGSRKKDAIILALAFRSAHQASDVWACLRFERALNEYKTASLGTYIDGCYLAAHIVDGEDFDDLEALKAEAEDFLASEVDY